MCGFRRGLCAGRRVVLAHRGAVVGPVVGAAGAAAGGRHARGGARAARARRAQLQLPRLRPRLQAQVVAAQPPEVGVRQGAPVPVPLLRLQGQAEDAHRPPHGADAPGGAHEARTVPEAGQRRRLHIVHTGRAVKFSHY